MPSGNVAGGLTLVHPGGGALVQPGLARTPWPAARPKSPLLGPGADFPVKHALGHGGRVLAGGARCRLGVLPCAPCGTAHRSYCSCSRAPSRRCRARGGATSGRATWAPASTALASQADAARASVHSRHHRHPSSRPRRPRPRPRPARPTRRCGLSTCGSRRSPRSACRHSTLRRGMACCLPTASRSR